MRIVLTGSTGFIGSSVLAQLLSAGHEVTALVRSEESAASVARPGVTTAVGDLADTAWVAGQLATAEGAIHTADLGAEGDAAFTAGVVEAFRGTAKPYVHTGGIWIWGNGADLTEESPLDPPAITAWRSTVEAPLLASDVAATVIAPGVVYGYGKGIPALLSGGPRTASGELVIIGDGTQHWSTVHVDDLAALYVLVLEQGSGLGHLLGVNGANETVRELGEAVAGSAGVATSTVEEVHGRLGTGFGDALLLDQSASGAKARSLGWAPAAPTLAEAFRAGY